eukprot:scaffold59810_cov100-Phaeocystis_antarctica.AAC.1
MPGCALEKPASNGPPSVVPPETVGPATLSGSVRRYATASGSVQPIAPNSAVPVFILEESPAAC